jgi:hypothetical protein
MTSTPVLRAVVLLLAIFPAALHAQNPRGPAQGPGLQMAQSNPIQVVLDARAELKLTDEQVALLEPARVRLEAVNAPLVARMDSLRQTMPAARGQGAGGGAGAGNREAMQAAMATLQPVRDQIQENNRLALESVRPHLDAAQWARVNELVQPRRRPGGRP